MNTININLPEEAVAKMIADKMKSDKSFSVFVIQVLAESYSLDHVLDTMQNGIPRQLFSTGATVYCTSIYYKDDKYIEIGECKVTDFNPANKYGAYTVEYISVDEETKQALTNVDKLFGSKEEAEAGQ